MTPNTCEVCGDAPARLVRVNGRVRRLCEYHADQAHADAYEGLDAAISDDQDRGETDMPRWEEGIHS